MQMARIRVITCNFVYRMYYKGENLEDIFNEYPVLAKSERNKAFFRYFVNKYIQKNKSYLARIEQQRLLGIL